MEETIICRCEEVKLGSIQTCIRRGACTAKEIKLQTRAGMGMCQGRTCRPLIDSLLSGFVSASSPTILSYRSPVRPILLSDLTKLPQSEKTCGGR